MEEVPELSQFESLVVILLRRIYDVQMTQLSLVSPEAADNLAELHEQGMTVGAPESILVDQDIE